MLTVFTEVNADPILALGSNKNGGEKALGLQISCINGSFSGNYNCTSVAFNCKSIAWKANGLCSGFTGNNYSSYHAMLKIASQNLSPLQKNLLKFSLSLRSYSATVQAFQQVCMDQ